MPPIKNIDNLFDHMKASIYENTVKYYLIWDTWLEP